MISPRTPQMDSPLIARLIKYELKGTEFVHDLMPHESYESGRMYLLNTYGDESTFYLTGEE